MISVIIPVFDGAQFIAAALRSVMRQTLLPDEVIVIDDGSSDTSAEIAAGFGPPIRVLRQKHHGCGTALNVGITVAKGELLAFLDADDLWTEGKLAQQKAALTSNLLLDAVFGYVVQFTDLDYQITDPREIKRMSRRFAGVHKSAMLIRRASFDRVGLFDPVMTADAVEWYARAIRIGIQMEILNQVVAYRRIHRNNSTLSRRSELHRNYLWIARRLISGRGDAPSC
jgi:glycosyltransferase involved in cell wall biosynthesis